MLQDMFAEGSAKDNQMIEHLGTQKHKCALGELELKHHKLENKVMEKQHQHEHERKQHEIHMMQMQMMMTQNQQATMMRLPTMMQAQNQPIFERYRLLAELNAGSPLSETPSPSTYSM